jgi:ATP-binding cassette subfamily C exporter for protease/lipase
MNHLFNMQSSLLGLIVSTHKKAFISVLIFSFVINILMLTPSFYMLLIFDRVLTSFNPWTLLALTLIAIFLYGLMALLERVRLLINASIASNIENDLSQKVYAASHRIQDQKTNIIQSLNDVAAIKQFISGPSVNSMLDVPWTPIFIFILFIFNFWMGIAAIISCAILIILTLVNERTTKRGQLDASKLMAASSLSAHDSARYSEVVGVMGMKKTLQTKWMKNHHVFSEKAFQMASLSANFSSLIKFFRLILQSLGLGFSAWLVLDNQIHPGMMIAGSILFSKTLGPIENISVILRQWEQLRFAESRLRDVIKDEYFVHEKISLPKPRGHLKVEGIRVTPPGNEVSVIHNLSFQSEAGQVIGILGPSGSGKSSLMRALVGAWPCGEGKIRWDGSHINDWNEDELGQYIGYVPQDIQLLRGTIAENIARFKEVESEAVIEAAKHAKAHDMILKLPNGYNTLLGEGGSGLSGGQRQKIAIARALFENPPIIILDEPSSFLDDTGRIELIQMMQMMQSKDRMIIFTTHHRDVVNVATKILVLVEGKLQAFGNSTDVLAKITKPPQTSK